MELKDPQRSQKCRGAGSLPELSKRASRPQPLPVSVTSALRSSYRHDLICARGASGRERKATSLHNSPPPSLSPSPPPSPLSLSLTPAATPFQNGAERTGNLLRGLQALGSGNAIVRSCLPPRTKGDSLLHTAPCTPRVWVQEPEMYWSHFYSSCDQALLDMCPHKALSELCGMVFTGEDLD